MTTLENQSCVFLAYLPSLWKKVILQDHHAVYVPISAFSSLKTEFLLNNIYKYSSYLTGNILRLYYIAQPVNAIWGNSRCLL
jgi:hypothetical protein